jgi:nitrous oxide reductase accessory protein NosL
MKKIWIALAAVAAGLLLVTGLFAGNDIEANKSCAYCGMDRGMFSHSRMLIEYDDGTIAATCSIHCSAVDLALNIDNTPKAIRVADYNSKELIDAEKAFWTMGGSKQGVMTKRAKWAFGSKENADAFMKANGGTLISFDQAMKASYEDMYGDTKMIREKRKMRGMSEGEHHHHHH